MKKFLALALATVLLTAPAFARVVKIPLVFLKDAITNNISNPGDASFVVASPTLANQRIIVATLILQAKAATDITIKCDTTTKFGPATFLANGALTQDFRAFACERGEDLIIEKSVPAAEVFVYVEYEED